MAEEEGRWIRRYRSAPEAAAQVVCLPHAGGAASYYRPMALRMFPAVEVLAVQYPGRQDRSGEPCIPTFDELTERTLAALRPAINRPVALFGHSMGALLAFEVAKRLEADGAGPLTLFASGRRPPGRPHPEPPHTAPDEDLIAEIAELNGTEERFLDDLDLVKMFLPSLRGDYEALSTYHLDADHKVACPVVSLTGDADTRVSIDDAAAWEAHTSGPFELNVFPGGHFYLNDQPEAVEEVLLKHINAHVPSGLG